MITVLRNSFRKSGRLGRVAAIAGLSFFGLLLSLGVQIVISRHFGTSTALDGYLIAYTIVTLTSFYVAPLRDAIGPRVFALRKRSPAEAEAFLASVGGWILIALSLSTGVALVVGVGIDSGFVPSGGPDRADVLRALFALAPAVLLLGVSEVLNGLFVCCDRPVAQQAVRLIAPIAMLCTVPWLVASQGVRALAAGVILGQAVMVLVQWSLLHRGGVRVTVGRPARLDAVLGLLGALLVVCFVANVHSLIERLVLSHAEAGLLSAYYYGVAVTNVLLTVTGLSVMNAIYPQLLAQSGSSDRSPVAAVVAVAVRWLVFVGAGIAVAVWIFAAELIELVFARGRFDAASVALTTGTLRATVFACVPASVYAIATRELLARQAGREVTMAGLGMAAAGLTVILVAVGLGSTPLLLTQWLVGNIAGAVLALWFVERSLGGLGGGFRRDVVAAGRPLAVAAPLCLAAWLVPAIHGAASPFVTLLVGGPVVGFFYLAGCALFGAIPPLPHQLRRT